jgi:hypothetical protein
MVMKKSGKENVKNGQNMLTIEMLEFIYKTLRPEDIERLEHLQKQLHEEYKEEDAFKRAYQVALIDLCRDIQTVTKKDLLALAKQRAMHVKEYMMKK